MSNQSFSQLNQSSAKASFAFGKENRFNEMRATISTFYDLRTTMSPRATTFGFGNKVSICANSPAPSPDKYNIASSFDKTTKRGFSIGFGRENCKNVSIFTQGKQPGPGQYNLPAHDTAKITMKQHLKMPKLFPETVSPGPAKYNSAQDEAKVLSKFRAMPCHRISPNNSCHLESTSLVLGPGSYHLNESSFGKQVIAKKASESAYRFPKKGRFDQQYKTLAPGPGAYNRYSEFERSLKSSQ